MKTKIKNIILYISAFILSVVFGMVLNNLGKYQCKYEDKIDVVHQSISEDKVKASEEELVPAGININTADISKLICLDEIGEITAQRIIDYRENNGSFETIEDILKVPGIGEKTFEKIKDFISVE